MNYDRYYYLYNYPQNNVHQEIIVEPPVEQIEYLHRQNMINIEKHHQKRLEEINKKYNDELSKNKQNYEMNLKKTLSNYQPLYYYESQNNSMNDFNQNLNTMAL